MAIEFLVPGRPDRFAGDGAAATRGGPAQPADVSPAGTLKAAVTVAQQRDGGQLVPVRAEPGEDVVVLQIANGPELFLHPETARDLVAAQDGASRGTAAPGSGEQVALPTRLQWPRRAPQETAQRGGGVALTALKLLGGERLQAAAADAIVAKFDAGVKAGVHRLTTAGLPAPGEGTPLAQVPPAATGQRILVLIHGTFSSTQGTFQRLWADHGDKVQALFRAYGDNVYALEHPTLGESPVQNALALARTLPAGAVLHLLTHSRGGLVAEVLARACAQQHGRDEDFAALDADPLSRDALRSLFDEVRERGLRVERIVRVACPARGTLLASRRLDAYLSVIRWLLQLAKVPLLPYFVEFLGAVARYRLDPLKIPGLAAQVPDSPLVQWLHAVDAPIAGELRVVAGDLAPDSVTSWLKTLMSDSFFWTDNDLVVQTRSMFGGAPRAQDAAFVLDAGGAVSHFSYFANEKTAQAVLDALLQDAPAGFRKIGPLSWAGQSATGVRALPRAGEREPQPQRPAVLVLPGIVGSNLKVDAHRIWLSWRLVNGFMQLAYVPDDPRVQPDGMMANTYDGLCTFLSPTHEVIPFDFDWRVPMEQEARRLAGVLEAAMAVRAESRQPVRLVAHSMGGLVTRVMQLERPQVWEAWMARPGTRLLMLGTPNEGSWAPMQVLTGDDNFGNALVAFGAPFRDREARTAMAGFPGLLQMQRGLLDPQQMLDRAETWKALAAQDIGRARKANAFHSTDTQVSLIEWGVPSQPVLDAAIALRKRLDAQREAVLPGFTDRMCIVLGTARRTPDGFQMGELGVEYLDLVEHGDGRVTDRNAMLPGVPSWRAPAVHGSLPACEQAWGAYLELLATGRTELLPAVSPGMRAAAAAAEGAAHEPSRPARLAGGTPPATSDPLTPGNDGAAAQDSGALRIVVHNSDLGFVHEPLLVGHYASLAVTGAEAAVDRLLAGKLTRALRAGDYPQQAGAVRVFSNTRLRDDNPWQLPRPEAVVVVGLGPEGKLTSEQLEKAVANAIVAWALAADDRRDPPAELEMSATLIGSGGMNITPGQSAQLIARAAREANKRLRNAAQDGQPGARRPPLLTRLRLVDLYLDRATDAWRALNALRAANPADFAVHERIESADSGLERPIHSSYRGAEFDLIVVTWTGTGAASRIAYRVDTRRARSELQAQAAQPSLLEQLLRTGSREGYTRRLGRTLFQLLVPIDLAPFLDAGGDTQLELDDRAAAIPWELLETPRDDENPMEREPWAIRTKLLRKLRTTDFRLQTRDAGRMDGVLVIGEPACPSPPYPRLPGARRETRAVAAALERAGLQGSVRALIASEDGGTVGADATAVIETLLDQPWRVVHISGHGAEPLQDEPRGVVLSGGIFLGPREIKAMRVVPELVFVNCCFSGALIDAPALAAGKDPLDFSRPAFAANVAIQLIDIGVKCVVATGWAVEDARAEIFANAFYGALGRGARFIDAVADARRAAYTPDDNTWGAYQCYGDPDWRLLGGIPDAQRPAPPLASAAPQAASVAELKLALREIATRATYQAAAGDADRLAVAALEQAFGDAWGGRGAVAEAFGLAWEAVGDMARAIRWFASALQAGDGGASYRSTERLYNLQARQAWESLREPAAAAGADQRQRAKEARATLQSARKGLARLLALAGSPERLSLVAAVDKRLAMVHLLLGDAAPARAAIEAMRDGYRQAWRAAGPSTSPEGFYPAMNVLAATLALQEPVAPEEASAVQSLVAAKARTDPDFWSVAAGIELDVWNALARGVLADHLEAIVRQLQDLHERVARVGFWRSLHDQTQFLALALREQLAPAEAEACKQLLRQLAAFADLPP